MVNGNPNHAWILHAVQVSLETISSHASIIPVAFYFVEINIDHAYLNHASVPAKLLASEPDRVA